MANKAKSKSPELSPRMRQFIDDLINEAEEAGIKPKHTADEEDDQRISVSS